MVCQSTSEPEVDKAKVPARKVRQRTRCPRPSLRVLLRSREIRGATVIGGRGSAHFLSLPIQMPISHRKSRFTWAPHGKVEPTHEIDHHAVFYH